MRNLQEERTRTSQATIETEKTLQNIKEEPLLEPAEWTIISALDWVVNQAKGSGLSNVFWKRVNNSLVYLRDRLGFTDMQIVLLAIMIEAGESLSWRKMGNFLGLSRISMMVYTDDLEDLIKKRWVVRRITQDLEGRFEGYALVFGVINALRHNKPFEPESLDGLNEQQFMDKLESYLSMNINRGNVIFADHEEWMMQLVEANPTLPICQMLKRFPNIHEKSLFLMVAFDYAQFADSPDEGLTLHTINELYPEEFKCDGIRNKLKTGEHVLIKSGYIEHKCEEGIANIYRYVLTQEAKEELLSEYTPSRSRCSATMNQNKFLKSYTEVKEKPLFYNSSEEEQINCLTSLLSQGNLPSVQQRLAERGMRKGFACLFYGAPGTGKTETVRQIARKTGRNIMQVDIAGLRDKYVGESEKNIKFVFMHYKKLCRQSVVMPILFFNEADGIFGKRTDNVRNSVDKMDNAMQNIILQEVENLEGILIATTNLTDNLDKAFERRFLFKVEFKKPDTEVKTKIWTSMLVNLSEEDAHSLAQRYDFSGGQIENIARKSAIDYVLYGKDATMEEINNYCRVEQLGGLLSRSAIGFRL